MNRDGVMQPRGDGRRCQGLPQAVAVRMSHDIQMPYVTSSVRLLWERKRRLAQHDAVAHGHLASGVVPSIEMTELHAEHSSLKAIHPIVVAQLVVVISRRLGVVAQAADASCDLIIVCRNGSAFAIGSQVFAWIKAEASKAAHASRKTATIEGAMSLRGVFDQRQPVPLAQFHEGVHLSH